MTDLGENVAIEITRDELGKLTNKYTYTRDHLGTHTRFLFKNFTVYEHPKPDGNGTILMRIDHREEEK